MRAVVVLVLLAACYSPQLERCTVRCSPGDSCPTDMVCESDHHCHEATDTSSCPVDRFSLTVTPAGSGTGLVTAMPQINCPGSCAEMVDYGTSVDLTATANGGSRFVSWGGACTGGTTCTVLVSDNTTVDANFALQEPLTVELMGNGGGDVFSIAPTDLGFDCPTQSSPCTVEVDQNTTITLMAQPDGSSAFAGWDGACASSTTDTCSVTLSGAATAIAYFN